jgi:hypothetical protein
MNQHCAMLLKTNQHCTVARRITSIVHSKETNQHCTVLKKRASFVAIKK